MPTRLISCSASSLVVPNSTAVPASVNRGVPIILDEPKHPVSVALRELAEKFVRAPEPGAQAEGQKSSETGSGRSSRWSLSRGGNR